MENNVGLAAIVAVVVSLVLEWFPGLSTWWDTYSAAQKRGIMAAIVAAISIAALGINCAYYGTCPADWLAAVRDVVLVFIAAAAGSQGVHLLSKRTE
jgi:hypothetical protein